MADNSTFEGWRGRLAALVMARMNRDMEAAALDLLAPADGERILVLGYGPGVGIAMLLDRCTPARVMALDPSAAMADVARRRLRGRGLADACVPGGAVTLVTGDVSALDAQAGPFDGVIAVNCHQLWSPLAPHTAAVAAHMAATARMVSVTHDWAITRRAPLEEWRAGASAALCAAGVGDLTWGEGRFRSGPGTWVVARRPTVAGAPST